MKAVILAAGVSRRLYPVTYDMPKCLIKVGEKSIIDHQLDSLKQSEINNVTIVSESNGSLLLSSTDTNTTYTAGDGLDLGGSEFSLDLKTKYLFSFFRLEVKTGLYFYIDAPFNLNLDRAHPKNDQKNEYIKKECLKAIKNCFFFLRNKTNFVGHIIF